MRRFLPLSFLAALAVLLLPARLAADLVWTPEGGWKVQGGVLAGFAGEEGRNALDLMNKARSAANEGWRSLSDITGGASGGRWSA